MQFVIRFFVACSILFFCSLEGSEISEILQKIPDKDKRRIEQLFDFFVRRDSLGYVLFGETKAVCATGIPISCTESVTPEAWTANPMRFQRNLRLCWESWVCHSHLFRHPNIIICEEYQKLGGGIYLHLYFINKKTLELVLEKFWCDFAEVLGSNSSPKHFISELEKKKKLKQLIHHDEKLFGLLLGFGRESSSAFKSYSSGIDLGSPLGRIAYRPKGCKITPVCFRGNLDSPEVQSLVNVYTDEILQIENIYNSDCFLETTLEKFCSQ
jgi:hypothetical protein